MELEGYRAFRQDYIDSGENLGTIIVKESSYSPDFRGRNTEQLWALVPNTESEPNQEGEPVFWVSSPTVNSLVPRTLHEVIIKNESSETPIEVRFARTYILVDEDILFDPTVALNMDYEPLRIGPKGKAHFYATAIASGSTIVLNMRTGTEDNRNI